MSPKKVQREKQDACGAPASPGSPVPVLVVDDETISLELMGEVVREIEGVRALMAQSVQEAVALLDREPCRVVVTDLRMPGRGGMELLSAVLERDSLAQVIVVSAQGGINDAVQAMKAGAFDYLVKPFRGEELRVTVEKALRQHALLVRQRGLEAELDSHPYHTEFIGSSPAADKVRQLVARAASVESTITLLGETGTGKELVARLIHRRSAHCRDPFIAVNCGALPAELVESELFGHSRGAFTGAVQDKEGRFEQARGGTIFLDEVGELPLAAQVKLLRVLENRTFERVGGTRTLSNRARLIAATHRDLREAVRAGTFREDLYYRLWVVPLAVPPLRERREDIPILAGFFVRQLSHLAADTPPVLEPGAVDLLKHYHWPGNVRELRNAVERALFLGGQLPLKAADFAFLGLESSPAKVSSMQSDLPLGKTLAEIERIVLERTYLECDQDARETASRLGVSKSWVYQKLKESQIQNLS